MKVTFPSLSEMTNQLICKEISFEDDSGQRLLLNALATHCAEYNNSRLRDFLSSSGAYDVDEYLVEALFFDGWEVDWFDVITGDIDSIELAQYISNTGSLEQSYNMELLINFVDDALHKWKSNVRHFLHKTLKEMES